MKRLKLWFLQTTDGRCLVRNEYQDRINGTTWRLDDELRLASPFRSAKAARKKAKELNRKQFSDIIFEADSFYMWV